MKQIPNLFTLLNLLFGCIAIVYITQSGLIPIFKNVGLNYFVPDLDINGNQIISLPEQIYLGSIFIGLAAIIDFFDGFVARLLKVSSEMGRQLDSLADLVSFGVAPGLIAYQFLRLSFSQQNNALDVNTIYLIPAFIIPLAGAYRLARFNIDTNQSYGFKGIPIPASGLLFASFPLIFLLTSREASWVIPILVNKWFWYTAILVVSYLMVSTLPMIALKSFNFTLKKGLPFLILALIALTGGLSFGWLAVPITFIAYVILSLTFKQNES